MATKRAPTPVMNADDYDHIVASLRQLEDMPGIIKKAQATGVDTAEYERNYQWLKNALETMQKEWFPKGLPR
jgi:hypothetical protein